MLPEAQLYHYKARVYDPALGRFLQADRVGSKDQIPERTDTPSELTQNPDRYDGKHVRVEGYVVVTSHAKNIFDTKRALSDAKAP